MRNRICVALAIASVAMVGCGVEDRRLVGGDGGVGGEAGQAGTGGEAGTGGAGGGTAGSGGSEDPGCVLEARTDEFRNPPRPKVDVLWVIDNSKAMAPFVDRIAGNLEGASIALLEQRIDFRLAMTTTGLEESPDCDGPVRGGEDGRFVPVDGSRPRILDPMAPDFATSLRDNLAVGACHGSSHPLEAAWRALSEPLATHEKDPRHDTDWMDGNAGFLRPDASLSIVLVTPIADVAGAERLPADYVDLFRTIKGRHGQVTLSAITGPKGTALPTGCAAEGGDGLIALSEETNGLAVDICSLTSDGKEWWHWGPRVSLPRGFYLRSLPSDRNGDGVVDEADLVVSVDGVKLAARNDDGHPVWAYDRLVNGIAFAPLYVPPQESVVRVTYLTCPPG